MRIEVGKEFAFAETRKVESPFHPGWWFTIRHADDEAYRAHQRARLAEAEGPEAAILAEWSKAQAVAQIKAGRRRGGDRKAFVEAEVERIMGVRLDKAVTVADVMKMASEAQDDIEGALLLLVRVDGVKAFGDDGKKIDGADKDLHRHLLSQEYKTGADYADSDPDVEFEVEEFTPLGRAHTRWIIVEAGKAAKFREEAIGAAEKN